MLQIALYIQFQIAVLIQVSTSLNVYGTPGYQNNTSWQSAELISLWSEYKMNNNLQYQSAVEELYRFKIFSDKVEMVKQHNLEYEKGNFKFMMKVSKFAELTSEEINNLLGHNAIEMTPRSYTNITINRRSIQFYRIPQSIDWRERNYVSPVKSQGRCGSCASYAIIGAIEGQYAKQTNRIISFSEQQILDCYVKTCEGKHVDDVYDLLINGDGITTLSSYPRTYNAKLNDYCYFKSTMAVVKVIDYSNLPYTDDNIVMQTLALIGPIVTTIDSSNKLLMYHKGIFDIKNCNKIKHNLMHAILLIGYGEENLVPYWILKNSWSTTWGENGFGRVLRGHDVCQLGKYISYPIIKPVFR